MSGAQRRAEQTERLTSYYKYGFVEHFPFDGFPEAMLRDPRHFPSYAFLRLEQIMLEWHYNFCLTVE